MGTELLTTSTAREATMLVFTCSGCAETEAFAKLAAALDAVHQDATQHPTQVVVADIRELEFASSSCLKAIVTWLDRIQDLDDTHRYKVRFRSDARHSWQRRSLGALAAFAGDIVEIES